MNAQEFYSNVGDLFGITGGDRVNPHRGVDFPWGEGTPIPSWCAGTVVRNEWNSVIGWILSIETSEGWAGFCHMASQSPLPVGAWVRQDDTLGLVGNTGTASRGAHLHATFSTVGNHPGTAPVVDPLPWIRSALIPKPKKEVAEMDYDYVFTEPNVRWALLHPLHIEGGYIETTDKKVAEGWANATGIAGRKVEPTAWANTLATAKALFGQAKAQRSTVGSVTVDNSDVVAAIVALGSRIDALPAEIDRYADGKKQS